MMLFLMYRLGVYRVRSTVNIDVVADHDEVLGFIERHRLYRNGIFRGVPAVPVGPVRAQL